MALGLAELSGTLTSLQLTEDGRFNLCLDVEEARDQGS